LLTGLAPSRASYRVYPASSFAFESVHVRVSSHPSRFESIWSRPLRGYTAPRGGRLILPANGPTRRCADGARPAISNWRAAASGGGTYRGETCAGTKSRVRRGRSRRRRRGQQKTAKSPTWAALPCGRLTAAISYILAARIRHLQNADGSCAYPALHRPV
jgi:hypothetical protein